MYDYKVQLHLFVQNNNTPAKFPPVVKLWHSKYKDNKIYKFYSQSLLFPTLVMSDRWPIPSATLIPAGNLCVVRTNYGGWTVRLEYIGSRMGLLDPVFLQGKSSDRILCKSDPDIPFPVTYGTWRHYDDTRIIINMYKCRRPFTSLKTAIWPGTCTALREKSSRRGVQNGSKLSSRRFTSHG